jgi:hypothetical protein
MIKQNKVAVIGAGIAGLSCATALEKAGFEVTVFEKSRGVSGRLSTRVTEHWQCDHGAQYFTARDPLFYEEVQRWIGANVAQLWQPSLKVFDGKTFSPKENDSKTKRYVGYPANNSPAKWIANALNVVTETTVTSIHRHTHQWQVNSKERGLCADHFDYVILSIPSPQAAALLNNTESSLASVCADVTMQPCFALMVHFNQRIHCQFDGLFINTGLLTWVARDSAKPGRSQDSNSDIETWVLHASSQWSKAHIDDEKELVAQQMLAEFSKILQFDNSLNTSKQVAISAQSYALHRWLYADCERYLMHAYEFDTEHGIGLCGDWLNGGKVQGAWLSGLKLANKLIAHNQDS